ncbi:MAG: NADH-quinone oxidoreductase subunit C [Planctomycetaceae bacterium]|nr:NADH-quinone oxidoreductase subunit C [Planctomycetaceae bacterium]
MNGDLLLKVRNGECFDASAIPPADINELRETVVTQVECGARIASFFVAQPFQAVSGRLESLRHPGQGARLICVLAFDKRSELGVIAADAKGSFQSLTPDCPQAHWFEREIFEQWGIEPTGHPWLKPVRFSNPGQKIGLTNFHHMEGDEVHEVAVGPVHAGVIEPGHFRFQCLGETVYHLEISLGYQHRGIERALVVNPGPRTRHYIETLAGDTTVGHMLAYCRAMESLTATHVPPRGQAIRGIAAELERLANHVGDLGALAGDVGFLPTQNYCGRLRGDLLNLTAAICGNRFGRGLICPGGAAWDLDHERADDMLVKLDAAEKDVRTAVELMFEAPSVLARFEGAGVVSAETASDIGLVGPAARACGLERDVRFNHAYGIYRFATLPVSTWHSGDCFARAYVRWQEIQRSFEFVRDQLRALPAGAAANKAGPAAGGKMVVTLVEGWRGEICHTLATDAQGCIAAYKVVDPSFHNWFGLAMSLRDQQISDFPLCNKSFNLSYCGHDL